MTGDLTRVGPLSPGSGEGPPQLGPRRRRSGARVGVSSSAARCRTWGRWSQSARSARLVPRSWTDSVLNGST